MATGPIRAASGVIVLDTETTGLSPVINEVTETAWWDSRTDTSHTFIPPHTLHGANPVALRVSRYYERIATLPQGHTVHVFDLWVRLGGLDPEHRKPVLAGSNPAFDAAMLNSLFTRHSLPPRPWASHLLNVGTAGSVLRGWRHANGHGWGLARLADELGVGVPEGAAHTAAGDVLTTRRVFAALGVDLHAGLPENLLTPARALTAAA